MLVELQRSLRCHMTAAIKNSSIIARLSLHFDSSSWELQNSFCPPSTETREKHEGRFQISREENCKRSILGPHFCGTSRRVVRIRCAVPGRTGANVRPPDWRLDHCGVVALSICPVSVPASPGGVLSAVQRETSKPAGLSLSQFTKLLI